VQFERVTLLDNSFQMHADDDLLWINVDPVFNPLRSDPHFQALLRRMNFPQ
jgi:hypothetical protein